MFSHKNKIKIFIFVNLKLILPCCPFNNRFPVLIILKILFSIILCVVLIFRAFVPRVPRHRHYQGDPTADCLPQHQQDQRGFWLGTPSSGDSAWQRCPQRQPRAISWSEHPMAGAAGRPRQWHAGAADPGAVQVPGGRPARGEAGAQRDVTWGEINK